MNSKITFATLLLINSAQALRLNEKLASLASVEQPSQI